MDDLDLINLYWQEINKNHFKLTDLVNKPQIFHLNNKCASCFSVLELMHGAHHVPPKVCYGMGFL